MILTARNFRYQFPRPALVMGILNVTPDSFSDGGRYLDPSAAVKHGLALIAAGADILDIGGESTRPGSHPVPEDEELRRVIPVIEILSRQVTVPISIDTMKPAVARAAVLAGASIINDVGANRQDPAMWRTVADTGVAYVCMHMLGNPLSMQLNPTYQDVVREVNLFFSDRVVRLNNCGIASAQIILDPGIGFGKTAEHNLELLAGLSQLDVQNRPLLIGVSRKSFIGKVCETKEANRLPGSIACACLGVAAGASIVRTHDVEETAQAIRMTEAILKRRKSN